MLQSHAIWPTGARAMLVALTLLTTAQDSDGITYKASFENGFCKFWVEGEHAVGCLSVPTTDAIKPLTGPGRLHVPNGYSVVYVYDKRYRKEGEDIDKDVIHSLACWNPTLPRPAVQPGAEAIASPAGQHINDARKAVQKHFSDMHLVIAEQSNLKMLTNKGQKCGEQQSDYAEIIDGKICVFYDSLYRIDGCLNVPADPNEVYAYTQGSKPFLEHPSCAKGTAKIVLFNENWQTVFGGKKRVEATKGKLSTNFSKCDPIPK